ncbi:major membrane immunogen (membrane-anchored lipoprotein) [Rhizobium ruizarguesonis]
MKRMLITLAIATALASPALACGGGFNDFVPCQAGQAGTTYQPSYQQDNDTGWAQIQQRQQQQQIQDQQRQIEQMQRDQSNPYGPSSYQ